MQEVAGLLFVSQVGKFEDGAVFLEVDDEDGVLGYLRKIVVDWCDHQGLKVYETSCFHITLFRENCLSNLPSCLDRDYMSVPLSFGIGAARCVRQDGTKSRLLRPVVTEFYHGKVRHFDMKAASLLDSKSCTSVPVKGPPIPPIKLANDPVYYHP